MDGRQIPSVAAIAFPSAREAGRRIAGVATAGRIVREVSEAGFASAWLSVPAGEAIDAAVMDDVRRLAGSMAIHIGDPPMDEPVAPIPADLLIPSDELPAFLTDDRIEPASAID